MCLRARSPVSSWWRLRRLDSTKRTLPKTNAIVRWAFKLMWVAGGHACTLQMMIMLCFAARRGAKKRSQDSPRFAHSETILKAGRTLDPLHVRCVGRRRPPPRGHTAAPAPASKQSKSPAVTKKRDGSEQRVCYIVLLEKLCARRGRWWRAVAATHVVSRRWRRRRGGLSGGECARRSGRWRRRGRLDSECCFNDA